MTLAYVPPGVTVQEQTNTSLSPQLGITSSVCLVGLAAGELTRTDPITLTRTTPIVLPNIPTDASMASDAIALVKDGLTSTGYSPLTDYAFDSTAHTIARRVTSTTLTGSAASAQANFTLASVADVTSVSTTTGSVTATKGGGFPNVTIGMGASGSNIAVGSVVVAVTATTITLSLPATGSGSATVSFTDVPAPGQIVRLESAGITIAAVTTTTGSFQATVVSGGFPSVTTGMAVTGTGIPLGTTVQSIVGNTIVFTQPATASGAVSLVFTTTELVTVQGVVGQVVTATTVLANTYISTATASWGAIPDGNQVFVTYAYTLADYFSPVRLSSMQAIQTRFGNVWDTTGTVINSPLSFAANNVIQNGASSVVLQPLFNAISGTPVQASATDNADPTIWAAVYATLQDLEDINLIVPVVGQSQANVTDSAQLTILEATQDFVYNMITTDGIYVEAVVGEDSSQSNSEAQAPTLRTHAQSLIPRHNGIVTEQLVFVNTAQFSVANNGSSTLVGGQYMAAALAGLLAANQPATTTTRVPVSGFLAVTDARTSQDKNTDAMNGMLVVENKASLVQVRHGITMDNTSAATRELNVVRAKQFIIASVKETLDTQVIGKVAADSDAPTIVNNVVIATLEDLLGLSQLSAYANVQSAIVSLDPTTMAVSFDYAPLFTVNYINIQYALDLTANSVLVTTNGTTSA